ncbi:MAG TPA: selenocysteine-specific translation elongation factor [Verrucomicrobiae bacterium]|nr:selenocysteine-specific translation elongation factor [Verrucomicrobiae bacterium]
MKHVIVGTAGHIDHGKSALIEALTGTHPDRLEEEKRRGITIDLGFAFLDLGSVRVGFVDVPGHEKFVRNMLAGVGGFDLVILVIAADESIKPQTREHFDICRLLGISRGIIAVTKTDLVDADWLGLVRLEIEDFVRGSFLEGAPFVGVSARTGAGLDDLKAALLRVSLESPSRNASRPFRLPIDRSFAMKGFGAVVTGTLLEGAVQPEMEVELYPTGRRARVRGLHSGGQAVPQAVAGQRTAVNLAGVERDDIRRGMVLGPPRSFDPTRRFDARLALLPSARPLAQRTRVHFHQGAAETIAQITLLESPEMLPGTSALAQLQLADSLVLLPGDRFILRQFSPVVTIGGGVVIDPRAPRHRRSDASVAPFLKTLETGAREEILAALLESLPRSLTPIEIRPRTGWLESEMSEAAKSLASKKRARIIRTDPLEVISSRTFASIVAAIQRAVEEFHLSNPLLPGVPKQVLRARSGSPAEETFASALEDLVAARKIVISGDLVQRAGREIALSQDEAKAKELIEGEFERAGLTVPTFAALLEKLPVEAARARKILQLLLREKALVRVSEDLVFHPEALARVRELLAKYRRERGDRIGVPAFKDLTGITRKYAIPLLEYLDREHVTRRAGDERVILLP